MHGHATRAGPAMEYPHVLECGPLRLSAIAAAMLASDADAQTLVAASGRVRLDPAAPGRPAASPAGDILAAWKRWGPQLVEEIDGEYAFALWCGRTRRLWLARDHMGQCPLFLAQDPGQLCFATDLRLLRGLVARSEPDPEAVLAHLLLLPGDPRRTCWRGLERVPASQLCRVDAAGGLQPRAHSALVPAGHASRTERDWVDGFRAHFLRAVGERFDARNTGAGLSGGLDSSAVAAGAAHLAGRVPLRLYAVRFADVPESDEGSHIAAFDAPAGALRELATAESPFACHQRLLPCLDEPLLLQNLHLWCALYDAARADGLEAMLDGHDGDTALGRWSSGLPARVAASWWRRAWRRWRRPPPPSLPLELLNPDFARRHDAAARVAAAREARERAARNPVDAHLHELGNGLPAYASERLAAIARAHGIAARHPLYDRELLRWCVAAPVSVKSREGHTRWLMRAALAGLLPEKLRWRADKTSLAPQFHRRFLEADAARVDDLLRAQADALAEFVDPPAVRRCWEAYRTRPDDRASAAIWAVATLAAWLAHAREAAHPEPDLPCGRADDAHTP